MEVVAKKLNVIILTPLLKQEIREEPFANTIQNVLTENAHIYILKSHLIQWQLPVVSNLKI